jgi:hypothetical protein
MKKDEKNIIKEDVAKILKVKDDLWKSRLKVQVIKEYFEEQIEHSAPPEISNYGAWSEGVVLILSEVIEAAEYADSILDGLAHQNAEVAA